MSWAFDAPTGTYKNHALSKDIREAAWADARIMPFLSPEKGYGKNKGETINITRFHNLPLADRVNELDLLPEGKPNVDVTSVTVSEWGFKVPMTNFEETLTHYDLSSKTQRMLKRQMTLTQDKMAADALKSTQHKLNSTSDAVFTTATDGSFDAAATDQLNVTHLRDIHDIMSGDLKIPKYANGKYIALVATGAARGIKNDTLYKEWQAPTQSGPFLDARIRDVEGFMIIEVNHFDALSNTAGTNDIGEALFFGEDAGFLAIASQPELRRDPATDLGRHFYLGWCGILEAGNTWGDDANNSRVLHWGSA